MLFGTRAASIIATKGSTDYAKYGIFKENSHVPKVTLYRLDGAKIKEKMSSDDLLRLQNKIRDIMQVKEIFKHMQSDPSLCSQLSLLMQVFDSLSGESTFFVLVPKLINASWLML